jgi:hypothetical protein
MNGAESLDALTAALVSAESSRRMIAAFELSKLTDPSVDELLWQAAADEDAKVRATAVQGLIRRNPLRPATPLLRCPRRADSDDPPSVGEIISFGLVGLESVDVVAPLISTLQSGESALRVCAACELAKSRDSRALTALLATVAGPDERVRQAATYALGRQGEAGVEPLVEIARIERSSREGACSCNSRPFRAERRRYRNGDRGRTHRPERVGKSKCPSDVGARRGGSRQEGSEAWTASGDASRAGVETMASAARSSRRASS